MLGINDGWVAAAYILCIASTLLCIVYGVLNWNKGDDGASSDEDLKWAAEEKKVEDKF